MEKYTSKLIFFDLDDTILKKDKSISKKTLENMDKSMENVEKGVAYGPITLK